MKKLLIVLGATALLSACDDATLATIPGTDQYQSRLAEVSAWERAVASVGCRIGTEAQFLPVELQTGLTRARVSEILSQKISAGEAVAMENGGYRYVAGPCTPAAAAVPAAT